MTVLSTNEAYQKTLIKKRIILASLLLITILMATISICVGSYSTSWSNSLMSIIGFGDAQERNIIFTIRAPRILMAVVAGSGLAVVGCIFQNVLRNPLASSSTLGISQGASFGASLAIVFFKAGTTASSSSNAITISNPLLVSILSFVFAMLPAFFVFFLAKTNRLTPETVILAGIALSALFQGGITLVQYLGEDVQVASAVYWTFGDLGRVNYGEIGVSFVICLTCFIYFFFNRWNYNSLLIGDNVAQGLGTNIKATRIISIVLGTLTASLITSFIGVVSFIGLLSPHIARRIIGNDHRYLVPASSLIGVIILIASDFFARTIISPIVLPIGAITSFLGAPLFIYLILRKKTSYA